MSELEDFDLIERKLAVRQERAIYNREHAIQQQLLAGGAIVAITVIRDRCVINGHKWLPERLGTMRCRVCSRWETPSTFKLPIYEESDDEDPTEINI